AVLVVAGDQTRRDLHSRRAAEDRYAEVRDVPPQGEAEHLLRSSEPGRHAGGEAALRIAVGGDARSLPGGVAVVEARPSQNPVRIEFQLRHLHVEPERDPPDVGTPGQDDETGAVAGRRPRRDREPQSERRSRRERRRLWLELRAVLQPLRVGRILPRWAPGP